MHFYKPVYFTCILFVVLFFLACSKDKIEEIVSEPENPPIITEELDSYEPGDAGKIESDRQVPVTELNTNQYQPGGEIEKSIDEDYATIYHSPWNGETSYPVILEYFFGPEAKTIDYAVLYPRQDGGTNGVILNITIYFKTEGDLDYRELDTYEYEQSMAPRIISFPEGIEDPMAIKLEVTKGMGDFVSLAEIEFFNEANLSEDLDVFKDKSATELKPGVNIDDIENIENSFIKNIAEAMFNHTYNEFRIGTFQSYPNPNNIAASNKTGSYGIYDNVTGIYLKSYSDMVVFAGDFDGDIFLRVVDHSKGFGGVDFPIRPGVNKFTTKGEEGLAYLIFQDDQEKEVKINFATGEVNGYFDIEKHTDFDWQNLLDNATFPFFDVLGKYSHLTFTTSAFQQYTDKPIELIELYDDIVELEQEFIGLYKYNRENSSRMYFRVNVHQDMYMFATSYRTEYSEGTLNTLANSENLKTSPWGPAHEVGHMNQTRPGLSWLGMTEVTTNIYSLHVQTTWGNASRIDSETLNGWSNRYEKAFTEIISDELAHNAHNDVFSKLVPFWQLQLYLADVKGFVDFYKDVHEVIREGEDMPSPGESQVEFVKITSDIAQMDLTEFFEKWGFLTPVNIEINDYGNGQFTVTQNMVDEAKSYIASKSYPKPDAAFHYITDSNVHVFTAQVAVIGGTAAVSGQNIVVNGSQNAAVYQQERNGKVIFISPRSSFTVESFLSEDKLFAVGFDGERLELQVN